MPRYVVQCIDRKTGEQRFEPIDAPNADAARKIASDFGYILGQVVEESPTGDLGPSDTYFPPSPPTPPQSLYIPNSSYSPGKAMESAAYGLALVGLATSATGGFLFGIPGALAGALPAWLGWICAAVAFEMSKGERTHRSANLCKLVSFLPLLYAIAKGIVAVVES